MDIRASWYPKNPHEEGSGEKIDAGDDAFFVAWAQKGVSIMIADGVGGARSVSGDEITPFLLCYSYWFLIFLNLFIHSSG